MSGTLPFVSENKVSAVTQPVAIPAIPASTSARQREAFLPAAARSNAHGVGGMETGRGSHPTPLLAPVGMVLYGFGGFALAFWLTAVAPRGRNVLILIYFVVVAGGSLDTGWCRVCIPKKPVSSTGHQSLTGCMYGAALLSPWGGQTAAEQPASCGVCSPG